MKELINEFIIELSIKNSSDNTIKNNKYVLHKYNEYLKGKSPDIVKTTKHYLYELKQTVSPSTLATYTQLIKQFLLFSGYKEAESIIIPKRPKRLPKSLTKEQLQQLLTIKTDSKTKLIIKLLLDTGLRVTELSNLKPNQIKGNTIQVIGKGNKERIVIFTDACKELLTQYIETNNIKDNQFIISNNGGASGKKMIERKIKKAGEQIQIHLTPHMLRHTFATHNMNRIGIKAVQQLLGHESLATTEVYTQLSNDDLNKLYQKNIGSMG